MNGLLLLELQKVFAEYNIPFDPNGETERIVANCEDIREVVLLKLPSIIRAFDDEQAYSSRFYLIREIAARVFKLKQLSEVPLRQGAFQITETDAKQWWEKFYNSVLDNEPLVL